MIDLFEAAPTFDDPLAMLRSCHRRIERALERLEAIATLEESGSLDDAAREALRQTLSYFATAVPRHAKDEEESLIPRVRGSLSEEERAMVCDLEAEHGEADALYRELEAVSAELLRSGRFERAEARRRFRMTVAALHRLYTEHIRREDDDLFPLAAARVPAAEWDAVGTEMAARRGIDWERQRRVAERLASRPWVRHTLQVEK